MPGAGPRRLPRERLLPHPGPQSSPAHAPEVAGTVLERAGGSCPPTDSSPIRSPGSLRRVLRPPPQRQHGRPTPGRRLSTGATRCVRPPSQRAAAGGARPAAHPPARRVAWAPRPAVQPAPQSLPAAPGAGAGRRRGDPTPCRRRPPAAPALARVCRRADKQPAPARSSPTATGREPPGAPSPPGLLGGRTASLSPAPPAPGGAATGHHEEVGPQVLRRPSRGELGVLPSSRQLHPVPGRRQGCSRGATPA